jgi:hypothetical protein
MDVAAKPMRLTMRKLLIALAAILALAGTAAAQRTIVSGTVTDTNGTPYSSATMVVTLSLPIGVSGAILNGVQIGGATQRVTLDATGSFLMQLGDNAVIQCTNAQGQIIACVPQTKWTFLVTFSPGVSPPIGSGPQTCTATVTITGASQSVSSSLNTCPVITNPAAGGAFGISTVGLQTPPELNVSNSPLVAPGGTISTAWNPQFANVVLAAGGQNSVAGVFDGGVTGQTISTQTSITLTATPKTTHDVAFFVSDEDRAIAQTGPPTMTGSGTWTSVATNGNFGATYQQLLTTSSPLTATANEGTATNWSSAMFFLTTNGGTPAAVQVGNAGGLFSCGNPGGSTTAFGSNTVIGHSILVIFQGLPSAAVLSFFPISDTQGNFFTPITIVQNQTRSVISAWLATNIVGATADSISVSCSSGQTVQGALIAIELSNIATTTGVGFRYLQPGDVAPFQQFGITNSTTCPTAAAAGSTCTFTENWPIRWKDTSYSVTCSGAGTITGEPVIEGITKAAGSAVVTVVNITAVAANYGEMDCIGSHP